MADTKAVKDVPLQLRRRKGEPIKTPKGEQQRYAPGALELTGPWPPRHEFGLVRLMEWIGQGLAVVDDQAINLRFANGAAVYRITLRPGETGPNGERTTGIWGALVESTREGGK